MTGHENPGTPDALHVELHEELLDLETQGWRALSSGSGGGFYRDRLTTDAFMVLPIGVLDRETSVRSMEQAPPWSRFEITEPRTTALGEGTAVLTYRVTAQRAGDPPYTALISSVYVKDPEGHKMAMHQQTPLMGL
jgi:hypothetical protein